MNTDKVLALAREARFQIHAYTKVAVVSASIEQLDVFAALIQQQMEAENAELRKDAEAFDEAIDRARSANDT